MINVGFCKELYNSRKDLAAQPWLMRAALLRSVRRVRARLPLLPRCAYKINRISLTMDGALHAKRLALSREPDRAPRSR